MTQFGDSGGGKETPHWSCGWRLDQPHEAGEECRELNPKLTNPLLSVCLITHNHVNYIRDALQGILMQQTRFQWELIVADDCSTDGTKEILEEYKERHPNLITLILQKKNVGAAQNWLELINTPRSKYIAYCEGDDYWTDSLKLQKQVDFLEDHADYGMIYSQAAVFNVGNGKYERGRLGRAFADWRELLLANPIPSLTVVVRTKLYHKYLVEMRPETRTWRMGDYPGWLWLSFHSKTHFLPEITATYRVSAESASNTSDSERRYRFNLNSFEIADHYARIYCCKSEYEKFLENRYQFLYLSCIKHNIPEQVNYVRRLRELKRLRWETKLGLVVLHDLKCAYLAHWMFGIVFRGAWSRTSGFGVFWGRH